MPSTVLLVDAGSGIRDLVERQIDPMSWTIVERDDVDVAWSEALARAPDLVVLNADVAKGWNLCAQLKRRFTTVPVVLLSYKANKELFNNHQKLPTRADAYHHLPDELEGLGISLSYFCSHKSEAPLDDDSPRPRARGASRVAVPTGVVAKLESTVRDQSRELESLKRQIEALEAERDAVTEKARRQMSELMSTSPGPDMATELAQEKKRRIEAVAELEVVRASARDASERLQASEDARRSAETTATNALSELVAMRATVRAAGHNAEQVAALTVQYQREHDRRVFAEREKAAAEERAATAERAWSGVNARAEELHQAVTARGLEVERALKEKADAETALAMSRKLMKDYIAEAARHAEAAKAAAERLREVEAAAAEAEQARAAAVGELEFQKTLVESLEDAQRRAAAQVKQLEVHAVELDADRIGTEAARVDAVRRAEAAEARAAALERDLQAAEAALSEAGTTQAADHEALAAERARHAEELAQAVAALEAELNELRDAHAATRAQLQAAAEAHATALAQASEARETALAQVAEAHAAALAQASEAHKAEIAATHDAHHAGLAQAQEAHAAAVAQASEAHAAELAAARAQLEAETATRVRLEGEVAAGRVEREAIEVNARDQFEALRLRTRKAERELHNSEAVRELVINRLQSLVNDLRQLPTQRSEAPAPAPQGPPPVPPGNGEPT